MEYALGFLTPNCEERFEDVIDEYALDSPMFDDLSTFDSMEVFSPNPMVTPCVSTPSSPGFRSYTPHATNELFFANAAPCGEIDEFGGFDEFDDFDLQHEPYCVTPPVQGGFGQDFATQDFVVQDHLVQDHLSQDPQVLKRQAAVENMDHATLRDAENWALTLNSNLSRMMNNGGDRRQITETMAALAKAERRVLTIKNASVAVSNNAAMHAKLLKDRAMVRAASRTEKARLRAIKSRERVRLERQKLLEHQKLLEGGAVTAVVASAVVAAPDAPSKNPPILMTNDVMRTVMAKRGMIPLPPCIDGDYTMSGELWKYYNSMSFRTNRFCDRARVCAWMLNPKIKVHTKTKNAVLLEQFCFNFYCENGMEGRRSATSLLRMLGMAHTELTAKMLADKKRE